MVLPEFVGFTTIVSQDFVPNFTGFCNILQFIFHEVSRLQKVISHCFGRQACTILPLLPKQQLILNASSSIVWVHFIDFSVLFSVSCFFWAKNSFSSLSCFLDSSGSNYCMMQQSSSLVAARGQHTQSQSSVVIAESVNCSYCIVSLAALLGSWTGKQQCHWNQTVSPACATAHKH